MVPRNQVPLLFDAQRVTVFSWTAGAPAYYIGLQCLQIGCDPRKCRKVAGVREEAAARRDDRVESRSGAVAFRAPFPDPAHQTGRADLPHPAFGTRVLLSLRPRQVVLKVGQPGYSKPLIKIVVGKLILDPPLYLVLSSQPLAQPASNVAIHAFIGFAHRAKPKIVGPSLQHQV